MSQHRGGLQKRYRVVIDREETFFLKKLNHELLKFFGRFVGIFFKMIVHLPFKSRERAPNRQKMLAVLLIHHQAGNVGTMRKSVYADEANKASK